jgi:hypothetical protein
MYTQYSTIKSAPFYRFIFVVLSDCSILCNLVLLDGSHYWLVTKAWVSEILEGLSDWLVIQWFNFLVEASDTRAKSRRKLSMVGRLPLDGRECWTKPLCLCLEGGLTLARNNFNYGNGGPSIVTRYACVALLSSSLDLRRDSEALVVSIFHLFVNISYSHRTAISPVCGQKFLLSAFFVIFCQPVLPWPIATNLS